MYKRGDLIRWRSPLDEDYSYGFIKEVKTRYVIVRGTGYYTGAEVQVHKKNIERLEQRGGDASGRSKKYN